MERKEFIEEKAIQEIFTENGIDIAHLITTAFCTGYACAVYKQNNDVKNLEHKQEFLSLLIKLATDHVKK